jgi:outer membrane protein, heavy metal efflux system
MSSCFGHLLLAGTFLLTSIPTSAEPLTLADALRQGLLSSPRVPLAKARADAAEARARQAGVSPNPEFSIEVENFAGSGAFQGLRSSETTLAVNQRFELGGKRTARIEVAQAERDFAFLTFKSVLADLQRDIRNAHASMRAAEDRALLARDNVGAALELLRTAKLLVDVGRDPPLRALRAEAQLAEANAEQARTFGELLAARQLLATLTGGSDGELSASDGLEDTPVNFPADFETLDIRLALSERAAALARVRLARAEAVPDVTGSVGVRRIADGGATAFVAGISIPLPVRNRNGGNIEAAQSESLAAESGLALARLDAHRARYESRMQLDAASARYDALAGPSMAQAEEAKRLAKIGYSAGKFSHFDLIDAQNALNQAKLNLIEARLDRARALAALIRANAQ